MGSHDGNFGMNHVTARQSMSLRRSFSLSVCLFVVIHLGTLRPVLLGRVVISVDGVACVVAGTADRM